MVSFETRVWSFGAFVLRRLSGRLPACTEGPSKHGHPQTPVPERRDHSPLLSEPSRTQSPFPQVPLNTATAPSARPRRPPPRSVQGLRVCPCPRASEGAGAPGLRAPALPPRRSSRTPVGPPALQCFPRLRCWVLLRRPHRTLPRPRIFHLPFPGRAYRGSPASAYLQTLPADPRRRPSCRTRVVSPACRDPDTYP